jgi:excisionase family DNA binding protein
MGATRPASQLPPRQNIAKTVAMSSVRIVDDAELLHVDRKTVDQAAQRGDIPHQRLGGRLLFERSTVLARLCTGGLSK